MKFIGSGKSDEERKQANAEFIAYAVVCLILAFVLYPVCEDLIPHITFN